MEDSLDTQPHTHLDKVTLKDSNNKTFFSLTNILIILAIVAIAGAGTYYFMNIS